MKDFKCSNPLFNYIHHYENNEFRSEDKKDLSKQNIHTLQYHSQYVC
jgi:hypothetical protein